MIVEDEGKKSLSFKFQTSKNTSNLKKLNNKEFTENVENKKNEFDYITEAEGNKLKSKNQKEEKGKLIIPLIRVNNWRTDGGIATEDKEAANELLKELEEQAEDLKAQIEPILMQNRLPRKRDDELTDEKHDILLRPEESTLEDYDNIPITSFGSAMLRGMGWSEGKPIGLNNKQIIEPIEYIPRHKGLGLGAEKRTDLNPRTRKRKLGEPTDVKTAAPVVDKDGRIHHVKGLHTESTSRPKGYFPGSYVQIERGVHKDLYGEIVSSDEDSARISVKLRLSGEVVQVSRFYAQLVDTEEYKKYGKKLPKEKTESNQNRSQSPPKMKSSSKKEKHVEVKKKKSRTWMHPNIKVRIISKEYKKGRYYNKKVDLLDVIGRDICCCRTDDNHLLEDVAEEDIETIIPRDVGSYILILRGDYRGKLAKLLERRKSCYEAVVQLTSDKSIVTVNYDDISQYIGELPDDEFL